VQFIIYQLAILRNRLQHHKLNFPYCILAVYNSYCLHPETLVFFQSLVLAIGRSVLFCRLSILLHLPPIRNNIINIISFYFLENFCTCNYYYTTLRVFICIYLYLYIQYINTSLFVFFRNYLLKY